MGLSTLQPQHRLAFHLLTGTPQGSVVSPLLANLFLHYAFDQWMVKTHPRIVFGRYADDIICHCRTKGEAVALLAQLEERFVACRLRLHPQKTKIIYCKDTHRTGRYPVVSFDFLGYTFQPRLAKWPNGEYGVSFLPAASQTALKEFRKAIRHWALQRRSDKSLDDLARMFGPFIRGWINYYSHFYQSALYSTLSLIDDHPRWAQRKHKTLRQRPKGARAWLAGVVRRTPGLFPHWRLLYANARVLGAVWTMAMGK
jgi:RNA-directed DNA polymerase